MNSANECCTVHCPTAVTSKTRPLQPRRGRRLEDTPCQNLLHNEPAMCENQQTSEVHRFGNAATFVYTSVPGFRFLECPEFQPAFDQAEDLAEETRASQPGERRASSWVLLASHPTVDGRRRR
ncbi:unnamed protein product [Arctogadus glacialis]